MENYKTKTHGNFYREKSKGNNWQGNLHFYRKYSSKSSIVLFGLILINQ